jgi:hypothetical protein
MGLVVVLPLGEDVADVVLLVPVPPLTVAGVVELVGGGGPSPVVAGGVVDVVPDDPDSVAVVLAPVPVEPVRATRP